MSGADPQAIRQWTEAGHWFAKADEDVCMAEMALGRDPPLIDPAAFHCQQAAEKIMKGLLVAAAVTAPRVHDLETLAAVCAPLYPDLAEIMADIAPASAWIARTRYPDLTEGVGAGKGEVAEMLAAISDFLRRAVSLGPRA